MEYSNMKTLIELFEKSVVKYSDNPLLWEKTNDQYTPSSYREIHRQVILFGAGLYSAGLSKGDRVGLLSEGRNSWMISELAILYCGAINVPLSVRLEAPELKFRLEHSEAKMVIVSSSQAAKITKVIDNLPLIKKVIYLDDNPDPGMKEVNFGDLVKAGEIFLESEENRRSFEGVYNSVLPDDIANISYTSGTTADPKGIMLTHLNYATNVIQANTVLEITQDYKTLAILPWDHSFAHTACLYTFMMKGASVGSVQSGRTPMETIRNIPINMREFKPEIMMSVPSLSKNFRKNIEKGIEAKGSLTEKLFNLGMKIAINYNGNGWNRGQGWRTFLKPLHVLFDIIIFSKVRDGFGGKLKFFIGGGALLDIELQRFFYAIGAPVYQGYGLTEAAPVISANCPDAVKFGSSGKIVKYLEVKICDSDGNTLPAGEKGEIVVKGDNVMKGYWKNQKATDETLKGGWLHTGDMGYFSSDGFLYVLGRFKSLLIGNDGEKFSPEGIEEAIVEQSAFIDQVMLYNNQDPYTVGLIVPNIHALNRLVEKQGFTPGSDEANMKSLELIQQEINAFRKGGKFDGQFPERWLPTAVVILPEAFTEQNHLLNSTMKMVRGKITERFKKELDFLYTPEGKEIKNRMNIQAIQAWNS
jgi:long-chain acyl-CoA synthetase